MFEWMRRTVLPNWTIKEIEDASGDQGRGVILDQKAK